MLVVKSFSSEFTDIFRYKPYISAMNANKIKIDNPITID